MYDMNDLVPIVAMLTEKYTGNDSSSVTYEKANQLMEAVVYCIREVQNGGEGILVSQQQSAMQAYRTGVQLVRRKTEELLVFYEHRKSRFCPYGNVYLADILQKGIPAFFRTYDEVFEPQNTILTLDYPLITDLSACTGIDRISAFLECVRLEQRFLGRFPQGYVRTVLKEHTEMYKEMIENLCEVVLLSVLKHMLAKKPLTEPRLEKDDHLRIQSICGQTDTAGLRQLLEEAVEALCVEYFEGDAGLCAYLQCAVADMAVRLKADSLY